MRHHRWTCAGVLLLLIASACSEPTSNEDPVAPESRTGITPTCELGCNEPDPEPTGPGIFLGSGVTLTVCTNGSQTDRDGDSLSDFCEKNLAAAFAPRMNFYSNDDTRGESRWAARYLTDGAGPRVRIVYLFSYYRDLGSHTFACSVPGPHYACLPHNGDSELVALDVFYNSSTTRWVLGEAIYSQHTEFKRYLRTVKGYPALEYPAGAGGYPNVYVAEGKHANYPTRSSCNSGGFAGQDTCVRVNTWVRWAAPGFQNIGSRGVRLIDCVVSQNPEYEYYGRGREECYWTTKRFRGWVPNTVGGGDAEGYGPRLARIVF